MHMCTAMAAGGTSQREKPDFAMVASRDRKLMQSEGETRLNRRVFPHGKDAPPRVDLAGCSKSEILHPLESLLRLAPFSLVLTAGLFCLMSNILKQNWLLSRR